MPILENPRHERFAQELAKGKTADEAYTKAGFKPNRGNAATLKAKQSVLDRVAELQAKGAELAAITIESITNNLVRIAKSAEAEGDSSGLSVARAAWMDVAKVNGLIVDRAETMATLFSISDEPMSSEGEWIAEHAGQPN